jgi:uncharacterized membrane protein HdeD (DUF308 family)
MTSDAVNAISSKWWTFLVRGVVALALAAFAFSMPETMAAGLVYIVAAYFIVSGVAALFGGLSLTGTGSWWALAFLGLVQAALGVVMLAEPGVGPLTLAYLLALCLISSGVVEISSAITLRNYISNEFWWVILGLVTLGFGFYVLVRPDIGLFALVYTIGIYAVLAGISLIALAFRVKNVGRAGRVKGSVAG